MRRFGVYRNTLFAYPGVVYFSHDRLEDRNVPAPRSEHGEVHALGVLDLQLAPDLAVPLLLGASFTSDDLPALLVALLSTANKIMTRVNTGDA